MRASRSQPRACSGDMYAIVPISLPGLVRRAPSGSVIMVLFSAHRQRPGQQLGESEVQHLGMAAIGNEDIGRLDVAMNDALLVRRVQRFGNVERNPQGLVGVQRIAVEHLEERVALHVLHHDVRTVAVLADFVHRADVGMVQSGSGARLAAKALQRGGVLDHVVRQEFQRHEAAKIEVLGLVNQSHTPTANQFNNAVVRYDRVDHRGISDGSPLVEC